MQIELGGCEVIYLISLARQAARDVHETPAYREICRRIADKLQAAEDDDTAAIRTLVKAGVHK